jgi:hypothetical protein
MRSKISSPIIYWIVNEPLVTETHFTKIVPEEVIVAFIGFYASLKLHVPPSKPATANSTS